MLVEFITNQTPPPSVYRATHASDPVPKLPFDNRFWNWSHTSPEYWIDQSTGEEVTPSVVHFIQGIDNQSGNAGTAENLGQDHLWYFGNMIVCEDPADKRKKGHGHAEI